MGNKHNQAVVQIEELTQQDAGRLGIGGYAVDDNEIAYGSEDYDRETRQSGQQHHGLALA